MVAKNKKIKKGLLQVNTSLSGSTCASPERGNWKTPQTTTQTFVDYAEKYHKQKGCTATNTDWETSGDWVKLMESYSQKVFPVSVIYLNATETCAQQRRLWGHPHGNTNDHQTKQQLLSKKTIAEWKLQLPFTVRYPTFWPLLDFFFFSLQISPTQLFPRLKKKYVRQK